MLIASIVTVAIGKTIVFQHTMAARIEYLNDTQTARNSIEMRVDCKKVNLQQCEIKDNNGTLILEDNVIWGVGRADVAVLCDNEGASVFVRQRGVMPNWTTLIPLKVCGMNGEKACNLTTNSDTISCTGGSNSY